MGDVVDADDSVGQQPHGDNGAEHDAHHARAELLNAEQQHDDADGNPINCPPAITECQHWCTGMGHPLDALALARSSLLKTMVCTHREQGSSCDDCNADLARCQCHGIRCLQASRTSKAFSPLWLPVSKHCMKAKGYTERRLAT